MMLAGYMQMCLMGILARSLETFWVLKATRKKKASGEIQPKNSDNA